MFTFFKCEQRISELYATEKGSCHHLNLKLLCDSAGGDGSEIFPLFFRFGGMSSFPSSLQESRLQLLGTSKWVAVHLLVTFSGSRLCLTCVFVVHWRDLQLTFNGLIIYFNCECKKNTFFLLLCSLATLD